MASCKFSEWMCACGLLAVERQGVLGLGGALLWALGPRGQAVLGWAASTYSGTNWGFALVAVCFVCSLVGI